VVIDIPTGRGAKIKTIGAADNLADDFIDLGRRLGINVQCGITFGEQPLGRAIGPALEAREALSTMMGIGPSDLIEKAVSIAGMLLEMVGARNGREIALKLLNSGKAENKLREIIQAQGGDESVKPDDISLGNKRANVTADKNGRVLWISNEDVARIAREAGAPKDRGAGIVLSVKLGDRVKKDQVMFEIFAEKTLNWRWQ
jgi:AMP phosphorylase